MEYKNHGISPLIEQEQEDFFDYIEREDIKEINEVLRRKGKIWLYISKEKNNSTILHFSVLKGLEELTDKFIKYVRENNKDGLESFINQQDDHGISAIHYASFKGNINIIKLLANNGADMYQRTKKRLNIIHLACQGNKVNSLMYFYLLFMKNNEKEGLQLFIEHDIEGSTPLHWSAFSESEDALLYLINFNIFKNENEKNEYLNKKDFNGLTALHLGVKKKSITIIKRLLENGINPDIKDNKGNTPLELAIGKNYIEIYEIIKNYRKYQISDVKQAEKVQKIKREIEIKQNELRFIKFVENDKLFIHNNLKNFISY